MAGYLAAQFPGDYYGGDEAKALDFMGYFDNQRQKASALQNQEINRQMALEDLYASQAERPLKEQRMSLENQGLEALLPQKRAQGQEAERNWSVRQAIPLATEQRSALAKIAKETTEDELKAEEAAIKRFMSDPANMTDPKNRERAEQMYGMLYEVRRMREGLQSKEDIAAMRAEMEREKQAAIAARAGASKKGSGMPVDPFGAAAKIRDPFEKYVEIKRVIAGLPADSPERARGEAMLASITQEAQEGVNRKANPSGFEKGPDGTWAPRAPIQLGNAGNAWVEKAMKANPGMTREQVIEEGKKRGKL